MLRVSLALMAVCLFTRAIVAQPAGDTTNELRLLILPPDKLPPGCAIARLPDAAAKPDYPVKANPQVSAERGFVDAFARQLLGPTFDSSQVQAALAAVYYEKLERNEIGIFALGFGAPEHAAAARATLHRKVNAGPAEANRFHIVAQGRLLVMLWRDDASDTAFKAFKDHVAAALEGPAGSPVAASQPGLAVPLGPGMGTKFFGVASDGPNAKIVYVVDSSGSMFATFAYVQAEVERSVKGLKADQQFHVIFFSDNVPIELTIDGKAQLRPATDDAKKAAQVWITQREAKSRAGTTDPRPALEAAFKVPGGPPDAIYFLTDGLFPRETLDTLKMLNPAGKVRINTIAFKDRIGEKLLSDIAKQHNGKYKFVSDEELGKDY